MPNLDIGGLIRQTRKLRSESEELCDRARHSVNESKRLQKRFAVLDAEYEDRTHRKRLPAK